MKHIRPLSVPVLPSESEGKSRCPTHGIRYIREMGIFQQEKEFCPVCKGESFIGPGV